jgi:hypothetical protein
MTIPFQDWKNGRCSNPTQEAVIYDDVLRTALDERRIAGVPDIACAPDAQRKSNCAGLIAVVWDRTPGGCASQLL